MRNVKATAYLVLKGVAMGSADIIPGVSGGTIAFITGIYEKLIRSIKSVDQRAFRLLISKDFKGVWKHINGNFLLPVFLGIIVSILSFARILSWLLDTYPIQLWSFFFGLVLIAAVSVFRTIKRRTGGVFLAGILGIAIAFTITQFSPAESPTGLWFVFLSGAIAICAMILPGISGSFLLLILGKYEYILNAVKGGDVLTLAVFMVGCLVGILSFVRLIAWLLERYNNVTISLLAGFMVGSLTKLWPWKVVTAYRVNSKGEQKPLLEENILPSNYLEVTGNEPYLLQAILFMALGIALVVLIEKLASTSERKNVTY